MQLSLKDLKKQVETLIKDYFANGRAGELIPALRVLIRKAGYARTASQLIRESVQSVQADMQAEFLERNLLSSSVISDSEKALRAVLDNAVRSLKYNEKRIFREVASVLKDPSQYPDWRDAAREAVRKIGVKEQHINTELNTQQAALDSAVRVNALRATGKRLLYEGPSPMRTFCQKHYNKTYTIAEAEKLINEFNQPALYYRGGYNCRHRWVPVD